MVTYSFYYSLFILPENNLLFQNLTIMQQVLRLEANKSENKIP